MTSHRHRRRDSAASRERLKAAARQVFDEAGFEGARTQAIAARAGLITHYFGGKRGLYTAVLAEDIARAQARLAPSADAGSPWPERFDRYLAGLAAAFAENPALVRILTREQMQGARNLTAPVRRALLGFFETTRKLATQGAGARRLAPRDAHALHLSAVGCLIYALLTAPARATYARGGPRVPPFDWDRYVDHVRGLFRRGLELEAEPPRGRAGRNAAERRLRSKEE